jgi:hypothetical protein
MRKTAIVLAAAAVALLGLTAPVGAVTGGQKIWTTGESCTAGVVLQSGSHSYLVTAGHCTRAQAGRSWSVAATGERLGSVVARAEYGPRDRGALRLPTRQSSTIRGARVTAIGNRGAGQSACVARGRTGGTACGTVVSGGNCLTYASPGLAARRICDLVLIRGVAVNPGDSGSPVYAGTTAVGILVARSATAGFAYYTPLTHLAHDWRLHL